MKRYELSIEIDDKEYVDTLIVALARQGFSPYIAYDKKCVCIQIDDTMMEEIKTNNG